MSSQRNKPLPPSVRRPPAGGPTSRPESPTKQSPRRGSTPNAPVSARGAARPKASALGSSSNTTEDDDSRAEMASALEDLKEQLQRAVYEAEEYKKHMSILQGRFDDAQREQVSLEDKAHEAEELLEERTNELRDHQRERKRLEGSYESEKAAMLKEREEWRTQEEKLRDIINNLKGVSHRSSRADLAEHRLSQMNPSSDTVSFAPPSTLQRSDSNSNSKLLLQKDKIIENLKLDLAEAQIKVAQANGLGGARLQELEKEVLELRMEKSRLIEENGNYETLLEEFTVNGEFSRSNLLKQSSSNPSSSHGTSSLADELGGESLNEEEGSTEDSITIRRLEQELKFSKEQNKALTVYVNNIIGRILQHKELEDVLDRTPGLMSGAPIPQPEKPLPSPPAPKESASGVSILHRTRSLATGSLRRPRPMSMMGPRMVPIAAPATITESEERPVHKRSNSDSAPAASTSASETSSSGYTGEVSSTADSSSRPSTSTEREEKAPAPVTGAAPHPAMAGNKLRPLRLVQENKAEDKAAKRGSWMGWLNQGDKNAPSIFSGLSLGGSS